MKAPCPLVCPWRSWGPGSGPSGGAEGWLWGGPPGRGGGGGGRGSGGGGGAKRPGGRVPDRLATALGTSIARLLDEPVRPGVVVLHCSQQHVVRDPSGWERRILSPVLPNVEFEFMRTTLEQGVDAGEFSPHAPGSHEYVAVE